MKEPVIFSIYYKNVFFSDIEKSIGDIVEEYKILHLNARAEIEWLSSSLGGFSYGVIAINGSAKSTVHIRILGEIACFKIESENEIAQDSIASFFQAKLLKKIKCPCPSNSWLENNF